MDAYGSGRAGGVYSMFGNTAASGEAEGSAQHMQQAEQKEDTQQGASSSATDLSAWTLDGTERALDLVFVRDTTRGTTGAAYTIQSLRAPS